MFFHEQLSSLGIVARFLIDLAITTQNSFNFMFKEQRTSLVLRHHSDDCSLLRISVEEHHVLLVVKV